VRRALLIAALGCVAAGLGAPAASADTTGVFGPIDLVSAGELREGQQPEQSEYANEPAIAGDGLYVAMHGSFGGVTGIWRRALAGDRLELVAKGNAVLPSISEEGTYISFTTTARLVPGDANNGPDVYVRDMEKPYAESCTTAMVSDETCPYKLVSAESGGEEALSYESEKALEPDEVETFEREYGSVAAGRTAISDNGQLVAFETTAESDLAGPHTPALQIAVRNLKSDTTELVSTDTNPETGEPITTGSGGSLRDVAVPELTNPGDERFGAAFPGGGGVPTFARLNLSNEESPEGSYTFGASISGDGNAVAWLGQDIAEQTRVLSGERAGLLGNDPEFSEPLWREIGEPLAPIRRIAGTSQPEAPKCEESGETEVSSPATLQDPCQGPFARASAAANGGLFSLGAEVANALPRLNADGSKAVFIANAPYLASGGEFGSAYEFTDDLYEATMEGGLTRVEAVHQLTEVAAARKAEALLDAPVTDDAISPAGEKVAFTTVRGVFPLQSLSFLSAPISIAGESELYVADLVNDTLTRVTHGYRGEEEPSEQPHLEEGGGSKDTYEGSDGTFAPSFTSNGEEIAFSSTAANLVYGDGNTPPLHTFQTGGGADSFVIRQIPFTPEPPHQEISEPPPNPAPVGYWQLYASGEPASGGATVTALVPGAGTVTASASAPAVTRGTFAAGSATSTSAGPIAVHLALPAALARYARSGGLTASVRVAFSAAGHATLVQRIAVTFDAAPGSFSARRHARRHRKHRRHGRRRRRR